MTLNKSDSSPQPYSFTKVECDCGSTGQTLYTVKDAEGLTVGSVALCNQCHGQSTILYLTPPFETPTVLGKIKEALEDLKWEQYRESLLPNISNSLASALLDAVEHLTSSLTCQPLDMAPENMVLLNCVQQGDWKGLRRTLYTVSGKLKKHQLVHHLPRGKIWGEIDDLHQLISLVFTWEAK
jgi:hypothetical protein